METDLFNPINSAGYSSLGALEDVPISEARHQFEVNVFGEPHASWYHATKYAVEGLSDSLRMEVKEFRIDV